MNLKSRVVRYADLNPCTNAFVDARTPTSLPCSSPPTITPRRRPTSPTSRKGCAPSTSASWNRA
jgi:hypothetical protein